MGHVLNVFAAVVCITGALACATSSFAQTAKPARNLVVARGDVAAIDQRIALVIGNAAYKTSPLANPVNDVRAMAAKLRTLGFTVIERENLTIRQIGSTLREFRSRLVPGALAGANKPIQPST